jgi:phage tail protein X
MSKRMPWEQRWAKYQHFVCEAQHAFESGNEIASWGWLLEAADTLWLPQPSARQVQQRKLWVERGRLETLKTLLTEVISADMREGRAFATMRVARNDVEQRIILNKEAMATL